MRITIILLGLFLSLTSCNDTKKENDTEAYPEQNINQNRDQNSEQNLDKKSKDTTSQTEVGKAEPASFEDFTGNYINTDHMEDNSCQCFCIEVTTSTSELCLKENELFINASFQQKGENIEIYYEGKSSRTANKDIPWDKFETGTPIAVFTPADNGFKLDWKGFSIDGDIAIDYALLGKKTLEATYKRK
ncbi:hypothetical protein [Christiangramia sp. SM2212]|uniref:Lipoprotein n=1 Tax=Christiangramia sediminicola TaxID=3073267 RepID=A0ABU1ESD1_9FLAO|nr:hypothetical protein [Christiangramia sp. SM2212]MDR5591073.1 hypothetical protein [Christiangramia sp. SM2212]